MEFKSHVKATEMKEGLTLKPMSPRLQHRQASMRKMKVKSPEKETATTPREDDQDSSLSGAPSAGQDNITLTKQLLSQYRTREHEYNTHNAHCILSSDYSYLCS